MGARPKGHVGNLAQRFMAAKLLAIASIVMTVGSLVNLTALIVPYWFEVKSTSLNTELPASDRVLTHYMGLFGYEKSSIHTRFEEMGWLQLNSVQKATNAMLVPDTLKVAQILWLLGTMSGIACSIGLLLISISQYLHLVAEIALAGGTTMSAMSLVISVVLSISSMGAACDEQNNWCTNMWRTTIVSLESVTWGFFIAVIGAVMTVVSAVFVWMQFCRTWRTVEYIRTTPYHPLDDETVYKQYDYRKTVHPRMDYAPAPPMITLPQMHHEEHGFPGVIISNRAQYQSPPTYSYRDDQGYRADRGQVYQDDPSQGYRKDPGYEQGLSSPGYQERSGSQEVSF